MESHSQQKQEKEGQQEGQQQVTTGETEEDFSLEQAKDLTQEEEDNLLQFLMKIQKACATDDSVPDFVGSQVNDWLKELNEKNDQEKKENE